MKVFEKINLDDDDKIHISKIWNNEYPISLNFSDSFGFEKYLTGLSNPNHFILRDQNNELLAWACKFERDNEKWFAIILDEKIHGKGKGTEILNLIKKNENELNAWVIDKENSYKINGEIYKSPLSFYSKNGFLVYPDVRMENEKVSAVKIVWKNIERASH